MAKIDKPLPNTKTTVEIPGEVEIEEAIQENVEEVQTDKRPVEIAMDEEGGAEVSFDPAVASPEGGEDHYSNLAEFPTIAASNAANKSGHRFITRSRLHLEIRRLGTFAFSACEQT